MDVDESEGETEGGGIAALGLVLAQGDAAVVLDPAEQVLNPVAASVGLRVVRDRLLSVALGWDDCLGLMLLKPVADLVGT